MIDFRTEGEVTYDLARNGECENDAGWSSPVARRAHNPKVAGSSPAPAPIRISKAADPLGSAAFGALDENFIQGFLCFGEDCINKGPAGSWRL